MWLWAIVAAGLVFMLAERVWPDQSLPHAPHWWLRAIGFNAAQLGVVLLGGGLWDQWLQRASVFALAETIEPIWGQAAVGYLVTTFVYYWWHRARHASDALWLVFHQVHHSPVRLETITAFYKHPMELVANSIVSGAISYTLLGLSVEGAAWVTAVSALSEFFYHMNIATPRWVGWFIQRPEMHRIHHERGVHQSNYGDLPVWDWCFGTYRNPPRYDGPCGFEGRRELRLTALLLARDVNAGEPR